MSEAIYLQYQKENLPDLAEKLNADYREPLEALTLMIEKMALVPYPDSYKKIVDVLVNKLKTFLSFKEELVLYSKQLHQKMVKGHDCRACSGDCSIDHSIRIAELYDHTRDIRQLLLEVHDFAITASSDIISRDSILKHKYGILLLEKTLCELFFLEEVFLVPAMKKAQKEIYARN
jgi:hypothetical protein